MQNLRSFVLLLAALGVFACGGDRNSGANPDPAAGTPIQERSAPQTVTIDSPDGVKLVGSFYEAANPTSPGLLLLHQWQSDRHSFDDLAARMQGDGFNVLSVDGRGFGDSTRRADGSTALAGRTDADVKAMLGDVGAAFDFLSNQKNVDPKRIGIIGASYGSSLALIFAGDRPEVAAVALLSPGLNYFGNMLTEPAIKKMGNRPVYMIAAEDDKESADAVRQLNPIVSNIAKYEQVIHPSGGHGTALLKVGGTEELEDFFIRKIRLH